MIWRLLGARARRRTAFSRIALASALAAFSAGLPASARESVAAVLSCPNSVRPGRVSCELAIRTGGAPLAWADALVTGAPDFARPLRARVGMSESTKKGATSITLPISLVATAPGSGELVVKARTVVCPAKVGSACIPFERRVRAPVTVAAESEQR